MKMFHRSAVVGVLLVFSLAALGVAQATHNGSSQQQDEEAHFEQVASLLELTDSQRNDLEGPFSQAHAAMMEFHRLHAEIVAELDDRQKKALASMLHEAMGSLMADGSRHEAHAGTRSGGTHSGGTHSGEKHGGSHASHGSHGASENGHR